MVQLLDRLEARLAVEIDAFRRGVLHAKRACYFARVGQFEKTRELVAQLRSDFPDGSSPRISIWVMLVEGLLHTFERLSPEGLDRMVRAQTLATALKDRELQAVSSAWLAHLLFERSEFVQMVSALQVALGSADDESFDALARVSMVFANTYASVGDRERATQWYMACRHYAVEAGDEATLEALLYNRAAFGVAWQRAEFCLGSGDRKPLEMLRRELASAHSFQDLTGAAALTNLVYLWEARLALLDDEFERAIDLLSGIRNVEPFSDESFHQSVIDLEVAYCSAKLGRVDDTLRFLTKRAAFDVHALHEDEQLYAAWLEVGVARCGAEFGDQPSAETRLDQARVTFLRSVEHMRNAITNLDHCRPPARTLMKVPLPTKSGQTTAT